METPMNSETIATVPATPDATTPTALGWARLQWAALETRGVALPAQLSTQLHRLWRDVAERLRGALDVPSRGELERLSARIEELSGQLAAAEERAAQAAAPVPVEAAVTRETPKRTVAEKRSRRR
jgi:hypothetical protein